MSKSLTLGKLSQYDDLLTDHLIDKVFFWIKTHKADRYKNHSSRRAKTQDIVKILQTHVIPCRNRAKLNIAVDAFLRLKTTNTFYTGLDTNQQRDFQNHLKKYLSMYLPSAGFEICSTSRYPGPKAESCVIANRSFRIGEVLDCLAGTIVAMTEEEEDYYEAEHDFSILHSSRLDAMCLFLGPARFVNHDCDPNGAFVTQGGSIAITTIKPVHIGDEITVFYSPDYFGPNNVDCLCETCETRGQGGYRTQEQKLNAQLEPRPSLSNATKKRNQVQTIEVGTRKSKAVSTDKLAQAKMITPPESEGSFEDTTRRSAEDGSETEDFRFLENPYYSDSADEDDCIVTADLGGRIVSNSARKRSVQRSRSNSLSTHIDQETRTSDTPQRRGLRPRKANCDYNLKRQSLLSLVPRTEDEKQPLPKRRSERKPGSDYCDVCEEELPADSRTEEVWSSTRAVGISPLICKRCQRHSKLYRDPWPKRTPVIMRRNSASQLEISDRISAGRLSALSASPDKLFRTNLPSRLSPDLSGPDSFTPAVSAIELVKARLKQGSIDLSRLNTLDASTSLSAGIDQASAKDLSTGQLPLSAISPRKVCKHCASLFCKCLYEAQDKQPIAESASKAGIRHTMTSSNKATAAEASDVYAFDESSRPRKYPAFKKRMSSPDSLKIDRSTLGVTKATTDTQGDKSRSPRSLMKQSMATNGARQLKSPSQNHSSHSRALSMAASEQVRETSLESGEQSQRGKKRRSAGTWYYQEVHSSDTDEGLPVVLESRTRSEDRKRLAVKRQKSFKKYFTPVPAGRTDEQVPYRSNTSKTRSPSVKE